LKSAFDRCGFLIISVTSLVVVMLFLMALWCDKSIIFSDVRYKNRPEMTFDDVGCTADQEFEMHSDSTGALEYVTKYDDTFIHLELVLVVVTVTMTVVVVVLVVVVVVVVVVPPPAPLLVSLWSLISCMKHELEHCDDGKLFLVMLVDKNSLDICLHIKLVTVILITRNTTSC